MPAEGGKGKEGKQKKLFKGEHRHRDTQSRLPKWGESLLMPTKNRRTNLLGGHPSLQIHSNQGPGTDCRPKTRGLRETGCRLETESCRQTATRRFDPE